MLQWQGLQNFKHTLEHQSMIEIYYNSWVNDLKTDEKAYRQKRRVRLRER